MKYYKSQPIEKSGQDTAFNMPYGGMYADDDASLIITTSSCPLCFETSMLLNRMTHMTDPCYLEISVAGIYEIRYKINTIPRFSAEEATLDINIEVNGAAYLAERYRLNKELMNYMNGTTYAELTSGDRVSLSSLASSTVSLNMLPGAHSFLVAKLIGGPISAI